MAMGNRTVCSAWGTWSAMSRWESGWRERQGRCLPCPHKWGTASCGTHGTAAGLLGCPSTTVTEWSLGDHPAPMECSHPWETAFSTGTSPCVPTDTPPRACMVPLGNAWQNTPSDAVWGNLCSQLHAGRWGTAAHSPCGLTSTAGWAGQAPRAPCVRSTAGAPWGGLSTLHWAQRAGRLAFWLYFSDNVWEH